MVDATIIKIYRHGQGQGISRSKGGITTKIPPALTDAPATSCASSSCLAIA